MSGYIHSYSPPYALTHAILYLLGMDKILQSVGDPNNRRITITNDGTHSLLPAV